MNSIIDPAIDTTARDASIFAAESAADLVVLHDLREAANAVCLANLNFTTDDIKKAANRTPREPRVMGAVMLWAQKQGYCVPTGNYRQSRDPECHCRPKMIWKSLIYNQAKP